MNTDLMIIDEAQRLKNWNTQIAQAIRRIHADYMVVLSGTPLENKLQELYSIVQLVNCKHNHTLTFRTNHRI